MDYDYKAIADEINSIVQKPHWTDWVEECIAILRAHFEPKTEPRKPIGYLRPTADGWERCDSTDSQGYPVYAPQSEPEQSVEMPYERPAEPHSSDGDPEQWCRVLAWEEERNKRLEAELARAKAEPGQDAKCLLCGGLGLVNDIEPNKPAVTCPRCSRPADAALREFAEDVLGWAEAYPTKIFNEPEPEKVRAVCESLGCTLDAIAAMVLRAFTKPWADKARAALASSPAREDDKEEAE